MLATLPERHPDTGWDGRGGGKMYGCVVMEVWSDSESWRKCLHHAGREIITPLCTVLWGEEGGERRRKRKIKRVTTVTWLVNGGG